LNVPDSAAWLDTAFTVSSTDDLLNDALTALVLAQIERSEHENEHLHASAVLYSMAMRKLSKRLSDRKQSFRESTLAAVMALSIYEVRQVTISRSRST